MYLQEVTVLLGLIKIFRPEATLLLGVSWEARMAA